MSRIFYEFSVNYSFATNSILRFMSIAAERLRVFSKGSVAGHLFLLASCGGCWRIRYKKR